MDMTDEDILALLLNAIKNKNHFWIIVDDGKKVTRINHGFPSYSLLGLCESMKDSILHQMRGEIHPDGKLLVLTDNKKDLEIVKKCSTCKHIFGDNGKCHECDTDTLNNWEAKEEK